MGRKLQTLLLGFKAAKLAIAVLAYLRRDFAR
jgi:hypothetical protein